VFAGSFETQYGKGVQPKKEKGKPFSFPLAMLPGLDLLQNILFPI